MSRQNNQPVTWYRNIPGHVLSFWLWVAMLTDPSAAEAQRTMEYLDRGVVALHHQPGGVFVSWRLLGTDPDSIAFHVYREQGDQSAIRLTRDPLLARTWFVDQDVNLETPVSYFVQAVDADRESARSKAVTLPANPPVQPYLSIPLQTPEGTSPNDASAGDLNGDGAYELVLHQASPGRDNSQAGKTGPAILQGYELDGTLLWTINLGPNIREGAHYTQFMVYDLTGDGRAEIAVKTADGTTDGLGTTIGDPNADHRNEAGYVLSGPEYLSVFDGETGAVLSTVDYIPPRHPDTRNPTAEQLDAIWGDGYGNRVDRFLACVAYLDGVHPSLVMCRGYYSRTVLAAWDWRNGSLQHRWTFDSDDGTPGNAAYRGQVNHGISVADVDGDGRDEIIYGSCVIDDDGTGLHSTGLGHGDAMHVSDLDPHRPGLEIFKANGDGPNPAGLQMRDAQTGEQLWGVRSTGRDGVGRALALDIDARFPGHEMWGKGEGVDGLFSAQGEKISDTAPQSCNMGIWWDGDLLRELLDGNRGYGFIGKWNATERRTDVLLDGRSYDCVTNNGSKANPSLCADIIGDWREEVVWATADGSELRIFSTTIPTPHRLPTLMHDPVYRLGIAWQNVAYNQPAHTGYFLGEGMPQPPRPEITTSRAE